MLKKTLYLLFACCLLAGCIDDYEWDTKMIVEGRVVDQNGNPVQGVTVNTEIYNERDFLFIFAIDPAVTEIISYTKTDSDGKYIMMFPRPKNEDDILILINADKDRNPINTSFSSTVIYNVKQENFNDHLINFGLNTVFPIQNLTELRVETFDDPSLTGEISNVNIEGLAQQNLIDYNFGIEGLQYLLFEQAYMVATNQILLVKYTIMTGDPNNPVYTTTEVPVQIGNEPVTYTINY